MNHLPENLEKNLLALLESVPFQVLKKSAEELSLAYREQTHGRKPRFMQSASHKLAYLALRMPATYAAASAALRDVRVNVESVLDLGSGPGTFYLAAKNLFPLIKRACLVEKDEELQKLAKKLTFEDARIIEYALADITHFKEGAQFDLVAASYALSELTQDQQDKVFQMMWQAASKLVCLVEPGTPYGFDVIERARNAFIAMGGHIVSPCTHEKGCPLAGSKDWCHFAVRLPRLELQRRIKEGALSYEDEKYSFLVVSKQPVNRAPFRIIKTPEKHSGHVRLTLCGETGMTQKVVSRKDKEVYKAAKELSWGDPF